MIGCTIRGIFLFGLLAVAGCASPPPGDPMQTVRDGLFYDGLAAYHEGFYREASVRWERAAHFGDSDAARNLGHLYRQGLGVERDLSIALAWYQVAADAGNHPARYNLGMLYLKGGEKVPPDRQKAQEWLRLAAEAGIRPAQGELERLAAEDAAAKAAPPPVPQESAVPPVPPSPPVTEVLAPGPEKARVQVGSYRTRKDAETDWKRLARPGLEPEIVSVVLKDGRRWFRLLAKGNAEVVESYCRDASAHRIGCWPGGPKPYSSSVTSAR